MNMRRMLLLMSGSGAAPAYYKKIITITGSSAGEQTDYPVRVAVTYDAKMNVDFSDLRFKSVAGVDLSYWIESSIASTSAVIWVKVPYIPAGASTIDINMYYGKTSYSSLANGDSVFSLFDDFTGILETSLHTTNPATPAIDTDLYLAENIVFDSVTNKYWWIMENRNVAPTTILLASADTIDGAWTVEASPVLSDAGHNLGSPCLVKFGSYWYIYYQYNDAGSGILSNINCAKSSTVNTGYSTAGITNPVIARGGVGTWEERRVLEPYVFQEGSTYYMFYMGEDTPGLVETTGYATASDPTGPWTKYASNPVLTGTGSGTWDDGLDKAADPFIFKVGNIFYVGVTGAVAGKAGWQVGFFQTTDFINFTECAGNPVLKKTTGAQFDATSAFRGAVFVENGIYYFPYTGVNVSAFKPGLTTLTFADNQLIDRGKWTVNGDPGYLVNGIITTSTVAYVVSISRFGQNYSVKTMTNLDSTLNSLIGFRDGAGPTYLELLSNYPSLSDVRAYQKLTADASSGDLGNPNAWHTYEVVRNANSAGIYYIDDVEKANISTQVPTSDLPVLIKNGALSDWIFVRKYVNPEPSPSTGVEQSGSY